MSREDINGSKELNGSIDKCTNGGLNGKNTINVVGEHVPGDVSPLTRFLPKAKKNFGSTPPLDDSYIRRALTTRSTSFERVVSVDVKNEAKVLVIYTGGTIGMTRNHEGALSPEPHAMEKVIRNTITMHDENYSQMRFGHQTKLAFAQDEAPREDAELADLLPLVLPHIPDLKRVVYQIYEYDPLLDSSNMTMDDWIHIAKTIETYYQKYDGFVIMHGTDTLAYTASALSFMLENLGKPVIVTGSQIPAFETRTDGRDNLVGALILAGNCNIPEVTVYFRHQLIRGNRTIKISSGELNAFESPNMAPLVKAGISFDIDHNSIFRPTTIAKFSVHTRLNRDVVLLRIFPSMRTETVAHFLKPPIQGVILQCYGAGNVPTNRKDIMRLFKDAAARGVIIVSVTQCMSGSVSALYATGKALLDMGVIPGNDMTPEAALTKLSYVLSKDEWDIDFKRQMIKTNLRGEMTVLKFQDEHSKKEMKNDDEEMNLIEAVAQALHIQTSEELEGLTEVLLPSLMCAAVFTGKISNLEALKSSYAAASALSDYDQRTPLHIAASMGNIVLVEYLLKNGASVHARDRNDATPLIDAIREGHNEVIEMLIESGAHLQYGTFELGEKLCMFARQGEDKKLECYRLAGANLSTSTNMARQTPLHAAVETAQEIAVSYLLERGVDTSKKDVYGRTPLDIAQLLNRQEIIQLLNDYNKPAK